MHIEGSIWFIFLSLVIVQFKQLVDPKTGEEKSVTISVDDGIRPNASLADLAKLKPVFKKDGSTTAGIVLLLSDININNMSVS